MTEEQRERAARGARRDFIKAQHPDRGGDPVEFVRGLQLRNSGNDATAGAVTARPGRGWRRSLARWHHRRQRRRAGLPPRHLQ